MVQMLVYLHSNVVLTLDVLPQKFHLIKREHGQNAANDGQTFDVGLFFIGPLVEVSGDGAKAVQDVAMQGGNGCWGLVVGIMQVRLEIGTNMSLISNKKFTNFKRSQRFAVGLEKNAIFFSFLCGTLKSDV